MVERGDKITSIDIVSNFNFPAVRGVQAGREYYVIMCPLKVIPRIFLFDKTELPPQVRAQRVLNKARVPEIANYLLKNKQDYVFSSITSLQDAKVQNHAWFPKNAGAICLKITSLTLQEEEKDQ